MSGQKFRDLRLDNSPPFSVSPLHFFPGAADGGEAAGREFLECLAFEASAKSRYRARDLRSPITPKDIPRARNKKFSARGGRISTRAPRRGCISCHERTRLYREGFEEYRGMERQKCGQRSSGGARSERMVSSERRGGSSEKRVWHRACTCHFHERQGVPRKDPGSSDPPVVEVGNKRYEMAEGWRARGAAVLGVRRKGTRLGHRERSTRIEIISSSGCLTPKAQRRKGPGRAARLPEIAEGSTFPNSPELRGTRTFCSSCFIAPAGY
ncbi:hypothetical protein KM043_003746 [Ampulex compressa]|nr:hypothetical protein KM043_003746 [Ampulex compressa]